mmetsp:Transcript_31982/g.23645  ORF Transcript_31982/g.23645 Transcript_31982/m.23645 type:complete len:92 (-) Transcript_31982:163-438(-)|eukprot:CAMPEP_0202968112 /NCGR_PEP_ID=MMETSP1396-20130829/13263_1 /ASSEMBLY_ACC=CAM_ASM_000872 /TAXON_ID= /ORGANISM="Pseudokeronopsis sp., Strain Brazil" /LENGTH=91 /DNA_ID=CAMNT_0049694023 /DNA_START=854 /DNA_END=1129 /DNA_ORIENTATION=-
MKESLNGKPLFIGKEIIQVKSDFFDLPFVKRVISKPIDELILHEVHGDHVTALPPGAKLFGSSETTNCELWTLGENVLCMQAHPEFNSGYI